MAEEHDKSYRLFFSFREMVENVLRRYVGGTWLEKLDFATLEKVSERDLSRELVRREKDLLWRLRFRDPWAEDSGWFYVYLHFELQSENEPFMALRVVTYKALLYEDLVRRKALTTSGKLPPVFSMVIYTGKAPWQGERSLERLIEPLPGLGAGDLPEGFSLLSYHLIEERRYSPEQLASEPGPVARLFEIEQSRDLGQLQQAVERLAQELSGPEWQDLRGSFGAWLSGVVIPSLAPGTKLDRIEDLLEVRSMLQQSVLEWRDSWIAQGRQEGRQEGRHEGRQEGRQEGRHEGVAAALLRLLEKKFGSVGPAIRARIEAAGADELLAWTERTLTARDLEQVFAA